MPTTFMRIFDPALIRTLLAEMKPDNLRQVVIAKELKTDKVEPYFDTHYSIRPLSESLVTRLTSPVVHSELTIPKPNDFVARDLELRKSSAVGEPEVLVEQTGFKVWSMSDSSFDVPRANIRVKVSTEKASDTAKDAVMLQLYRALLSRSLNEYGYPAKEAGLNYGLSTGREGLMIALSGYQDKQGLLLEDILKGIKSFNSSKAEFEQERALLTRRIRNKQFQPPYRQGMDLLSQKLYPNYRDDKALLAAADKVTLADVKAYSEDFYDDIHIEMLVHGNFSQEESLKLAELVENSLLTEENRSTKFKQPFTLLKDDNSTLKAAFNHNDSVYISYFQRPGTDNSDRARYSLLGRLLATPFFNELRTEQQLGYIVFAGARPMERHPGLIFVVQSPVLGPDGIEERVTRFLEGQSKRLDKLTDGELDQYRQGLIGDLLKKDANLDERSARFWQTLDGGEVGFYFPETDCGSGGNNHGKRYSECYGQYS